MLNVDNRNMNCFVPVFLVAIQSLKYFVWFYIIMASDFHACVLLLTMNFVMILSK